MNRLPTLDMDIAGLDLPAWFAALGEIGEEFGYFERVGPRHGALFIDSGPQLLVTFETVDEIRKRPEQAPRGLDFAHRNGWSLLALMCEEDTWFRDRAVYALFDRLTDDGFFDDFASVLFTGAGAGGYAAAAYSVAAPGARVLALRPQATLDPAVAGWDHRFRECRRIDFTSRYGYAPDMIDAAARVHVLHDPCRPLDAMHAALFRRPNVTVLAAPLSGPRPERLLDAMGILAPLVETAMAGTLDRAGFARRWRARRQNAAWLQALVARLETRGRFALAARVCLHALALGHRQVFARKIEDLAARGIVVAAQAGPPQRDTAPRQEPRDTAPRQEPRDNASRQEPRDNTSRQEPRNHAPRRIEAAG